MPTAFALVLGLFLLASACPPPRAVQAIEARADGAYAAGRFREAADLYLALAEAREGRPRATAYYNAACCLARAGEPEGALEVLELAVEAGYANRSHLEGDADLRGLREDPRFLALLDAVPATTITITQDLAPSGAQARFVFDDARRFLRAMERADAGEPLERCLREEYLERASPGLAQFLVKYPFDVDELVAAIERQPAAYARVAASLARLEARTADFRAVFARYDALVPGAVFPPTYFLVGCHRGIASGSPDGQLITIERRTEASIDHLETLLVHELTHFQQLVRVGPDAFYALFGRDKSLLGLSLREGVAEYLAQRLTGRITQPDAWAYVLEHESELWPRFRERMHGAATTGWMWSEPEVTGAPRDLAYALGCRIVEAYHERAGGGPAIFARILGHTDYAAFLTESGYGDD